jgi:hypothetical protein
MLPSALLAWTRTDGYAVSAAVRAEKLAGLSVIEGDRVMARRGAGVDPMRTRVVLKDPRIDDHAQPLDRPFEGEHVSVSGWAAVGDYESVIGLAPVVSGSLEEMRSGRGAASPNFGGLGVHSDQVVHLRWEA